MGPDLMFLMQQMCIRDRFQDIAAIMLVAIMPQIFTATPDSWETALNIGMAVPVSYTQLSPSGANSGVEKKGSLMWPPCVWPESIRSQR